MHILISPNAFKNSLDATAGATAIKEGLQQSRLSFTATCFPIGDGGDGTGKLLTERCFGTFVSTETIDPLGRKINASFGLIDDDKTAVIEMASASGLHLLQSNELNPLLASSYGTGIQMVKALDKGVTKILLCVGGSATVDGGCGILEALGARFLDKNGNALTGMPAGLINLYSIDYSGLDTRIHNCECIILCDVANTLLGPNGAATVFGPQKGASEKEVRQLESCLTQFNHVVLETRGIDISALKHGGAAGGTVAGLCAFLNARPVNGIDHFLDITEFDKSLGEADLLITGEGSMDLQTLEGKAPYGVALRAKKKNIPVIVLAGKVPDKINPLLNDFFDVLLAIGHTPTDIASALISTRDDLFRTAMQLGNLLAMKR